MAEDNRTRCRCTSSHGCACTKAGKPVPVPASLPGHLAAVVRPLTAAGRRQEVKRQAAKEQFFGSQPPSVRRRAGLAPHPETPTPLRVSAAVPWRFPGALVASSKQPFYSTEDAEDRSWRAAHDAAMAIAHLEAANLAGESLTAVQQGACVSYATLVTAGAIDEATGVLDTLRRSAREMRRKRVREAMDAQAVRVLGRTGALVASAQRQRVGQLEHLADRVLGREQAEQRRKMRALRRRVDRARFPGGGSAA